MGSFDVQALYAALDARRRDRELTWVRVAAEVGSVSASTIVRTRHADDLEADGMVQMVRWLRLAPESFARDRTSGGPVPMTAATRGARGVLRVDTVALHGALDARRAELRMNWAATAAELGLSASRLTGLRRGGRTTAQVFVSAARWLGRSTETLVRVDSSSPDGGTGAER